MTHVPAIWVLYVRCWLEACFSEWVAFLYFYYYYYYYSAESILHALILPPCIPLHVCWCDMYNPEPAPWILPGSGRRQVGNWWSDPARSPVSLPKGVAKPVCAPVDCCDLWLVVLGPFVYYPLQFGVLRLVWTVHYYFATIQVNNSVIIVGSLRSEAPLRAGLCWVVMGLCPEMPSDDDDELIIWSSSSSTRHRQEAFRIKSKTSRGQRPGLKQSTTI